MAFARRRLLQILPFAFASNLSSARGNPDAQVEIAQSTAAASAASGDMEKVSGIGGLFFRAQDPSALAHWYLEHLGISLTPMAKGDLPWQQDAGPTAFTPFPEKTKYFGDLSKVWMVNFRVRNLERMATQLRAAGIAIELDPTTYPNGRFAHLHDPEGNPIELWQPA
jgi:predicted enzyme related to lactoylglutathione lyase